MGCSRSQARFPSQLELVQHVLAGSCPGKKKNNLFGLDLGCCSPCLPEPGGCTLCISPSSHRAPRQCSPPREA